MPAPTAETDAVIDMPIREENKARYPQNWLQISKAVRAKAGDKCEQCGVPNRVKIKRFTSEKYKGLPVFCIWDSGKVHSAEDGTLLGFEHPASLDEVTDGKWVIVVLTVAHLDHTPENCDPDNLRAWCQRCHNAYDAPMRRAGTKARTRSKAAVADLFGGAHG